MEKILSGPPLPSNFWDELDISFGNYIMNYIRRNDDKIYMINGETDEKIYLSEFAEKSSNLAVQLQHLGCKVDTRVAIYSENRIEYSIALFGIFLSGSTVVTLNHLYTLDELQHCISVAKPTVLFCSNDTYSKAKEAQKNNSYITYIILLDNRSTYDTEIKLYSNLIEKSNKKLQEPGHDSNRTLAILFSSGTTGLPKGVMLTHRNMLYMIHMIEITNIYQYEGGYYLSSLPMFHSYGMTANFSTIVLGKTLVFLKKYEEELYLSLIQKYKIESLLLVPPMIVNFIKSDKVQKYDISSVTQIICGAAPLKLSTEKQVKEKFNVKSVQQGYGMTENVVAITSKRAENLKGGTCGTVLAGTVVKVVDPETGKDLGFREIGEICIKGPGVMKGYFNDVEATATTIRNGWLHSGDLGYYDEDGDFFIIDRLKELIKYNGFQIAPAELEGILVKHPLVRDAGVIGIFDEVAGELPKAFVVKKLDAKISEKELQDYVASLVSPQKRLRGGVSFVDEIPKNPSGKILRRKLREMNGGSFIKCKY